MIPPIFINCIGFVRNDQSNSAECLFSLSAQYSSTQEIVGAQRKRDWKRVKLIYIYTTLLHFIVGNEYIFFSQNLNDCRNCELNVYFSDVPSCQWQVHGRIDSTKTRNIARTGRRRRRRRKSTSPINQAERIMIYNTYTCVQFVYTCQI